MSAKWRRKKRRSRLPNVFTDANKARGENTPENSENKNPRRRRRTFPCKHGLPRIYGERFRRDIEPLIDVLEEEEEIIVVAGLAGFKEGDMKFQVKDQHLTLSAESAHRKIHKGLNLPKRVFPNSARSTLKNGVLEIRLRKALAEKAIKKMTG